MNQQVKPKVGVIGLGAMGLGVARALLRAGFEVTGYTPRREVLQQFASEGGRIAQNPAEVGRQASVVILLVLNAQQTEQVLFGENGLAAAMAPGSVIITGATIDPATAEQIGERLHAMGLLNIDAPVSGSSAHATAGQLSVMAAGRPEAFEKAQPVFDAYAAKLYRLGDTPGQGNKVKMINQLLAGVHIAAAAEAMSLGIKAGADPQVLYDVITHSAGNSWMFENRAPFVLKGDYAPYSQVDIFVKDLGIVLDSARSHNFPAPLTATAHQMYIAASAAGHGKEHDIAVIKFFPGVDLPQPKDAEQK